MPRATKGERVERDYLVYGLWLSGHTLRAIAAHPEVNLSVGMVSRVLKREALAVDVLDEFEQRYAAMYEAASKGNPRARQHCRLILERLERLGLPPDERSSRVMAMNFAEYYRRRGAVKAKAKKSRCQG